MDSVDQSSLGAVNPSFLPDAASHALALEAAHAVSWDADLVQREVLLDERWAELLGESPGRTRSTTIALMNRVHPDDQRRVLREEVAVTSGQLPEYNVKHRVRHRQGHWIWICTRGKVVRRHPVTGRAERMVGINADITAEKEHEDRILRQKKFLEALHQTTLDLLTETDLDRLLNLIVERTATLIGACASEISLVENDRLAVIASTTQKLSTLTGPSSREDAPLSWEAHDTGKVVVIDDYSRHPQRRRIYDGQKIRAAVIFPIMDGPTCQGVIALLRLTNPLPFSAEEIQHGELLVRQAALVIHNARIHREAVEAATRQTKALRESEALFHGVFDHSPDVIGLLTVPDGKVVEINDAGLTAFGAKREDVLGRSTTELNIWVSLAERDRYLARLVADGVVTDFEADMRRLNGEHFTVLYNGRLISIGGKRYSLNTLRDITERKQAEFALIQFRTAMDQSSDSILLINPEDGRFVDCNQTACSRLGYTRTELLHLGVMDIEAVLPDTFQWQEHRRQVQEAGRLRILGNHRCKDGASFPVEVNVCYLAMEPHDSMVAIARDITERRQGEVALRQSEARLRQAQKIESIGTLAGGIAHDFNNILTGILGCTELIRFELPAGHAALQWVERITDSGNRARLLVQQILTFSRKGESHQVRMPIVPVANEAIRLLRATLPAMVKITTDFPDLSPTVRGDPTQFHQVIINLCTNAWRALPENGGRIEVSIAECKIDETVTDCTPVLEPGKYVRLRVTDDGQGMDEYTKERIFDPFFTTYASGTGLGLAVVHGIVRSHSGRIRVQSRPGEGACFDLYFPALRDSAPPADPAVVPQRTHGLGEKILLIDDDEHAGTAMEHLLGQLGYRVTLHQHPHTALALGWENLARFDLVITDLAMPGTSGLEVAAQLRAHCPHLPILVTSGLVNPAQHEKLRALGLEQVLNKPPTVDDLAQAVARRLSRKA